jgi:hypothetical protein
MTKDEALRLALDALEMSDICADDCKCTRKRAINGIKAALEANDETVEVKHMMRWVDGLKRQSDNGQHMNIPSGLSAGTCWELANELEQFINSTQPQRKPLTDEEIEDAWASCEPDWDDKVNVITLARAIEAAHGIKGEA